MNTDDVLDLVRRKLSEQGVDLEQICSPGGERVAKVVCIAADLKDSVRELGESTREHVVMVRVDDETRKSLDDWVETGAVRSRSAGAALFLKEGLAVRAAELDKLKGALRDVEQARQRLRDKARDVLGQQDEPTRPGGEEK